MDLRILGTMKGWPGPFWSLAVFSSKCGAGADMGTAGHLVWPDIGALGGAVFRRDCYGFGPARRRLQQDRRVDIGVLPLQVARVLFFGLVMGVSVVAMAGSLAAEARASASVWLCASVATCNAKGRCVDTPYRAAVLEVQRFDTGRAGTSEELFFMGPVKDGAVGGSFFGEDAFVSVEMPDPGSIPGLIADTALPDDDYVWVFPAPGWDGFPRRLFHVRPGRDVGWLFGARVATEFTCEQGLF